MVGLVVMDTNVHNIIRIKVEAQEIQEVGDLLVIVMQ
jgi:hypothetical protein